MLHIKYKPKTFEEMVGNKGVVDKFLKYIKTSSIPHCVLLSGMRGCGKSTTAELLAKAIPNAYVETIDGAISSGVEVSRDLVSDITSMPLGYSNRVIILEEIHNVSKKFLEALLLVTNDPPSNVFFFATTTEASKVLGTLKSRFIKFDFKPPTEVEIKNHVKKIIEKEGIDLNRKVLHTLCNKNQNIPRDVLTDLELLLGVGSTEEQLALLHDYEKDEKYIGYKIAMHLHQDWHWDKLRSQLKGISDSDVEGIRRYVLKFHANKLLEGFGRSAFVLDSFKNPFYDSGTAGLFLAIHECLEVD